MPSPIFTLEVSDNESSLLMKCLQLDSDIRKVAEADKDPDLFRRADKFHELCEYIARREGRNSRSVAYFALTFTADGLAALVAY